MATVTESRTEWNVRDLFQRFGPISVGRIRQRPEPGTANEQDAIAVNDSDKCLCELVDGILVEKAMGARESLLAGLILTAINQFVLPRKLGYVLGADGLVRLAHGLLRIPDVCFIAANRAPGRRFPETPICPLIPNLVVEVLSAGNTKKEMAEKLDDYFRAGVELVWYVDPAKKTVRVYISLEDSRLVRESGTIDGGIVLPGFTLRLRDLFADPLAEDQLP